MLFSAKLYRIVLMKTKDKIFLSIGTIALITTIGFGGYSVINRQTQSNTTPTVVTVQTADTATPTPTTPSTTTTTPVTTTSNKYKDGTYTASATYSVPHGSNSISVNVTIANDAITNVSTNHTYKDSESGMYVDSFDSYISSKVVGKSVSSLSLSRVGGASLTTIGFNNALNTIVKNAAA